MKRALWIGVMLALLAIIIVSIARPHQMLAPGKVQAAHAALESDCFACHTPFRGASSARCTSCHALADIGLRTTKGVIITRKGQAPAFHQALANADCTSCHSEHQSAATVGPKSARFDHALLKPDARSNCRLCHAAPRDALHSGKQLDCATCHQTSGWKPATFEHSRFFELVGDHNASCATCHPGGNYKRYTCYGCHEHQPADILAEHREEGITNIDNCVRCHRSAHGEREGEGREHDD